MIIPGLEWGQEYLPGGIRSVHICAKLIPADLSGTPQNRYQYIMNSNTTTGPIAAIKYDLETTQKSLQNSTLIIRFGGDLSEITIFSAH